MVIVRASLGPGAGARRLSPGISGQVRVDELVCHVSDSVSYRAKVCCRSKLPCGGPSADPDSDRRVPRQCHPLMYDRLIEGERLLQILHAAGAVAKHLEDADAGGVPERLEEVRLQGLQLEAPAWLGHANVNIAILLYSQ